MESPTARVSPEEIIYLDWNNALEILEKAHRSGLEQGILDIAVPMAYTPDNGRFQSLVRSARAESEG